MTMIVKETYLIFMFSFLLNQAAFSQESKPVPPYLLFSETEAQTKNRSPNLPYITGDAFRAYCDYILDEAYPELLVSEIQEGSTIFVATHFLEVFFKCYHPSISVKYILVSHNSDEAAPGPFAAYLEDEKIIAWFAQNVEGPTHRKLFPIPIGLENRYCPNGMDFSLLGEMIRQYEDAPRDVLLYMNITPRARSDRDRVFNLFKDRNYCKTISGIFYIEYLRDLGRSKFVLSPRGNGLDCLRTWESLYMGAIPIVKTSACDEMYKDLPVLIVQDWDEITEGFLMNAFDVLKQGQYNLDKIYISYWHQLIDIAKKTGQPPTK